MVTTERSQSFESVTVAEEIRPRPAVFVAVLKPRAVIRPDHHFVSVSHLIDYFFRQVISSTSRTSPPRAGARGGPACDGRKSE